MGASLAAVAVAVVAGAAVVVVGAVVGVVAVGLLVAAAAVAVGAWGYLLRVAVVGACWAQENRCCPVRAGLWEWGAGCYSAADYSGWLGQGS